MTDLLDFIDNRGGNTLTRALGVVLGASVGSEISDSETPPDTVCIATAFFNPTGFAQIADYLKPVRSIRLMLGTEVDSGRLGERKLLVETREEFEQRNLRVGLHRMDSVLCRERDRLPFTRTSGIALRKLVKALRSGNLEVRRYEKAFMHAKTYIVESGDGLRGRQSSSIVGSSNLTGAGLTHNLELNVVCSDRTITKRAQNWFDELWEDAAPYDLASVFEQVLQPWSPWEIFLRALWQLYGDEIEEDTKVDNNLPLTSFQKHGVARALRLIREWGGVIVADEVGLGKTFIAGEILQFYSERRQRALLVCPASLRDSTWKQFLNTYQLFVECLSFEGLANDVQIVGAKQSNATVQNLQRPVDEYQLIIVDEAHNYRNPDTPTRAAVMRRLMSGRRREILLLTATPVNNSLWDLYHLLRFFLRQDASLANRGILSIRERFERAMKEDPSSLSPDVLYPVIDATTVKRTRQFVKKYYAGDTITGHDNKTLPIVFPNPIALSVRYKLDDLLPGFFDKLERALDPDHEDSIAFARYMPNNYLLSSSDEEENGRARALVGLLRSGLLKRFESSVFAFRRTVEKMVQEHDVFLDALKSGHVVTTAFMKELSADDDDVFEDILSSTEQSTDARLYDIDILRGTVTRDRRILHELTRDVTQINPHQDPKLRKLVDALVEIAKQAKREANSAIDETQKRKVLVFSFFEDTVKWILDFIKLEVDLCPEIQIYRDRFVAVSGSGNLSKVSRQKVVQGFAPQSMGAPPGQDTDLYDLLISTDVLAEGVNLQQCRHVINFDLPWNPMRLVQRHGRIDRIGSRHARVFMRTIFPVDRLEQMLNLEQRILNKLALAAASVGVVAPIEGAAHGSQVFTETREEIEKLLNEDASLYELGGTVGAVQSGEEYRQILRKALGEEQKRVTNLPWKVGSGMAKGTRRGIFFCAVVGKKSDYERTYLRFVPASADWSYKIEDQGIERELGVCLRLIECTANTRTCYPDILKERVYDFWEVARKDILDYWNREIDPANLQPSIRPLNRRIANFIRANLPFGVSNTRVTSALDILESPWPRREEVMLRGWFETSGNEGAELSRFLIDEINKSGLEPVSVPPPLPPIVPEDIELLCWLGIQPQSTDSD